MTGLFGQGRRWLPGRRDTAADSATIRAGGQVLPDQQVVNSTVADSVVQISGTGRDVHVRFGARNYRVNNQLPTPARLTVQQARAQPARLLHARHQLVSFTGRASELRTLSNWRDGDAGISVLLLHGAGGQGKTRLAVRFAEQSRARGWQVLQARHVSDPPPVTAASAAGEKNNTPDTLVLADYAERWPVDDLLEFLREAAGRGGGRARVLLVARPAGVWWQILANRLDRMDVATTSLALPSLVTDRATSPAELYSQARDRFAEALGVSGAQHLPVPSAVLSDAPGIRNVLAVHMTALAAVDRHRRGEAGGAAMDAPGAVSAYLLSRERDHWRTLCANGRIKTSDSILARAVFTAALTGSLSHHEGVTALKVIQACPSDVTDQVLREHAELFPPDADRQGAVLEPLYPDPLAEDFVALGTPGHHFSHPPDPWAEDAMHRLLVPGTDEDSVHPWTRPALTSLIAASARWPHLVTGHLAPLLMRHPELMLHAGGSALTALTEVPELSPSVLENVAARLPDHPHAEFDAGIAAITSKLISHRLRATNDPAERARLHSSLATRQAYAGKYQQAVSAAEAAVEIGRQLVRLNSELHEPDLAASLSNLGNRFAQVGRHDEALECAREAVWIRQRLVSNAPDAQAPGLAQALSNLGVRLAEVGRHAEALATEEVAIDIRRRLAAADSARFEADYATSSSNLGNHLAHLGRHDEALSCEEEAVEIRRRLAAENPAAHEPDLARSLSNLGVRLARVGRPDEALSCEEEAVEIRRRLAAENPAAHEPDLARSLSNLGVRLARVGRPDEALSCEEEAVEIRRRLAAENPAAHEPAE
ncbi:ATP-binding protein [Streptomyces bathyalis]|uniref:ATP-binding protein n=1 Tax=Streptomyces bathyalis TaxID=2710756 RepID=A0A7T1WSN7_9ACTN|nr:tetratricopeptide repeat protein [Streptomyces bathyalis]QPP07332.1 ATP-binding protein [Streptomyces bathyalis]